MPLYGIKDCKSGSAQEDFWGSYDDLQEFLKNNTHLEQAFSALTIVSGIAGVTHKNDSGFNDLMSRVAAANPWTPMANKHGPKDIKTVKTRDVINKYRQ